MLTHNTGMYMYSHVYTCTHILTLEIIHACAVTHDMAPASIFRFIKKKKHFRFKICAHNYTVYARSTGSYNYNMRYSELHVFNKPLAVYSACACSVRIGRTCRVSRLDVCRPLPISPLIAGKISLRSKHLNLQKVYIM